MRSPQITLVGQSVSWLLCARLLSLALAFYFLASALPVAAADDQPPNAKRALFMPMINGGNATTLESHTPVAVSGLSGGTNSPRATPAAVTGLTSGMKAVAAGYFHACAANKSGGVQCWGNNQSSRLGDGTTADSLVPVAVSGLSSGVTALVAGWGHTCALTTSGGVKCWGSNASGQLGDNTTEFSPGPVDVLWP